MSINNTIAPDHTAVKTPLSPYSASKIINDKYRSYINFLASKIDFVACEISKNGEIYCFR